MQLMSPINGKKVSFPFKPHLSQLRGYWKIGRQLGISACPSYLCVYFFFIYRDAFNCRFQLNCIFNRKLCCIVYLVILSMKGNETQASKSKYGKNIRTGGKPEILRWV